jgi:RHS repeat-associated protein
VSERLIQTNDGSATFNNTGTPIAQYAYDPFGRRIKKTILQATTPDAQTGTTLYLYSDDGLIAELDSIGTITVSYGWAPNGTWGTAPIYKRDHAGQSGAVNNQGSAAPTNNNTGSTNPASPASPANAANAANTANTANTANAANGIEHLYYHDHLGTPIRLTNAQGETTWRAVTEAFGRTTIDPSIAPITTGTTTNNLRFPGQYEDQETGTHYNFMRTYLPYAGRYGETDPIGLLAGFNTYAYAFSSPNIYFDSLGLQSQKTWPTCVLIPIGPWINNESPYKKNDRSKRIFLDMDWTLAGSNDSPSVEPSAPPADEPWAPKICANIGLKLVIYELYLVTVDYDLFQKQVRKVIHECTAKEECGKSTTNYYDSEESQETFVRKVNGTRIDKEIFKEITFGAPTPMCVDSPTRPRAPRRR